MINSKFINYVSEYKIWYANGLWTYLETVYELLFVRLQLRII